MFTDGNEGCRRPSVIIYGKADEIIKQYVSKNKERTTGIMKGDLDTCYRKIIDEFRSVDCELIDLLEHYKCVNLSIEDQVRLYAKLRETLDGDIVIRIVDRDNIEMMSHDDRIYISLQDLEKII